MFAFSLSLPLSLSTYHSSTHRRTHTHTHSLTLCLSLNPSSHRYLVKCTGSRISFKPYSLSRVRCRSVIFSRERLTKKKKKKKEWQSSTQRDEKGILFHGVGCTTRSRPLPPHRSFKTWGKRNKELRVKFRRLRAVRLVSCCCSGKREKGRKIERGKE